MSCNGSGRLDCYCGGDRCLHASPPECPGCIECRPRDLAEALEAELDGLRHFTLANGRQVDLTNAAEVLDLIHTERSCVVHRLAGFYDAAIAELGVGPAQKVDQRAKGFDSAEKLRHLRWMLSAIPGLPNAVKAERWLGFVQGVLFATGVFSIDELRGHVTGAMR